MNEWIKSNQSWLVVFSLFGLFLMFIGAALDFQKEIFEIRSDYVTQTRYYNYNKEQDQTIIRLQDQVNVLREALTETRVEVAKNSAKLNMIID